MATNAQRIAALEAAVKTLTSQVNQIKTRVKALELIVNPPAAATPFTADFTSDFGGTQ